MRYYKGEHYREVYDLLGADYALDAANGLQDSEIKKLGDKVGYHNDGIVKWSGVFYQVEHKNDIISTFCNITASNSAYKRVDFFRKKDLVLSDTTYVEALGTSVATELEFDNDGNLIGANKTMIEDTIWHNGTAYTMNSDEAKLAETDWKWIRGFTIKSGANINLDEFNIL